MFLFLSPAAYAQSFQYLGTCYVDQNAALEAVLSSELFLNGYFYRPAASTSISSAGLVTLTMRRYDLITAVQEVGTPFSFGLRHCSVLSGFDPLAAGGFFSIALVSVIFIWLTAKQSGEIVNALRRW